MIFRKLLVLLAVLNLLSLYAQQPVPCAFDRLVNNYKLLHAEQIIQEELQKKSNHDTMVIPVVVHVFHQGGSENISFAQIESAIEVLNEDFGRMVGTSGFGNGVDTKVLFKLAQLDPNGNCTNGVVRIYSSLTNHKTYERPLLKEVSFWDNQKYLNIYVVKSIPGGTLGYSSFPGAPAEEDGLVVRHNYFGRTGTAASSLGRTVTHEVGHWLGLYHTFNNGCGTDVCSDGDYVCDTPPVATANFGCTSSNSCSNDSPDLPDQIENYMDYTSETCSNMFTAGQADRIHASLTSLRTNIWSQSNLEDTGCDSLFTPPSSCGVVANFVSLHPEICINNSVDFIDISLNGVTDWEWTFPGGTPATSTLQNPQVSYNALGNYDVKLVVSNGTTIDSITLVNYVSVTNPGIGDPLPYQEDFESGVFPPAGMTIVNPDGGIAWELDSNAWVSPTHSIRFDNLNSTNYGTLDEIHLPFLDFSSNSTTPYLKFSWAYAKSVSLYTDEMIVQLSTDCGATWTQIFYRANNSLVTGPTQTTPFIPDSSQWKNALVSLSSYASETYVLIKIVNVTDGGNFLYIDDISVGDIDLNVTTLAPLSYDVYPNPNNGSFTISTSITSPVTWQLISIDGQYIDRFEQSTATETFTLPHLSKGIYFIQESSGQYGVKKIVIH